LPNSLLGDEELLDPLLDPLLEPLLLLLLEPLLDSSFVGLEERVGLDFFSIYFPGAKTFPYTEPSDRGQ
jgi:hypothetical protein